MLARIVISVLLGIIATLVFSLVGGLLITVDVTWVAAIGAFFKAYASLLGLLVALYHFFGDGSIIK